MQTKFLFIELPTNLLEEYQISNNLLSLTNTGLKDLVSAILINLVKFELRWDDDTKRSD